MQLHTWYVAFKWLRNYIDISTGFHVVLTGNSKTKVTLSSTLPFSELPVSSNLENTWSPCRHPFYIVLDHTETLTSLQHSSLLLILCHIQQSQMYGGCEHATPGTVQKRSGLGRQPPKSAVSFTLCSFSDLQACIFGDSAIIWMREGNKYCQSLTAMNGILLIEVLMLLIAKQLLSLLLYKLIRLFILPTSSLLF